MALSRWVLNIFKDRNSVSSWTKLFLCLTSHCEECLYPVGISLHATSGFCLLSFCCARMINVWLHQVYNTSLSCGTIMWAPCPGLLSFRLDKSNSLRLSSYILFFRPLTSLMSLSWTLSHSLTSSLYWGIQNWTQYSRGNLTSMI